MKIVRYIPRKKVEAKVKELLHEYGTLPEIKLQRNAVKGDLGWVCGIYGEKYGIDYMNALELLDNLPEYGLYNFYQDLLKVKVR